MFAARAGHADVVAALLARGARSRTPPPRSGATPAFVAPNSVPGFGFGVGILRGGVPADRGRREPTPGGMTPLLYAARHDHVEVAKRLIAAGADVNAKEANGIWPLLMAISNDNMAVAHYLLEQRQRRERPGLVRTQPAVGSGERAQSLRAQRDVQERHRSRAACWSSSRHCLRPAPT